MKIEREKAASGKSSEEMEGEDRAIRLETEEDKWRTADEADSGDEIDEGYTLDDWWLENRPSSGAGQNDLTRAWRGVLVRANIQFHDKKAALKHYVALLKATLKTYREDPHSAKEDLIKLRIKFQKYLTRRQSKK